MSSFILNTEYTAVTNQESLTCGDTPQPTCHITPNMPHKGSFRGNTAGVGSRDRIPPYHTPLYRIKRGRADAEKKKPYHLYNFKANTL